MDNSPEQLRAYFDATTTPLDLDRFTDATGDRDRLLNDQPARRRSAAVTVNLAPNHQSPERRWGRGRTAAAIVLGSAAAIVLIVASVAVLNRRDEPPAPASPTPNTASTVVSEPTPTTLSAPAPPPTTAPNRPSAAEVLRAYEIAVNSRDLTAVMALYSEEATVAAHPLSGDLLDITEIRRAENALLIQLRSTEAEVFFVTDVRVDDGVATFGHVGLVSECVAGTGHRAIVEDGLIRSIEWGTNEQPCVIDLVRDVGDLMLADPAEAARRFDTNGSVTGDPLTGVTGDPAVGRERIAAVLVALGDTSGSGATVEFRDETWRGPDATFDLVVVDDGVCRVFSGARATAEGGLITSWDFGVDLGEAPCA